MLLQQIMTKPVATLGPDDSVGKAASLMSDLSVGVVPVVDRDRPVGIVTDRDVVIRCVARRLDPRATPVKQVMSSTPECATPDEDVADVAQRMQDRKIRRVVVCDSDRRPVGIVSLGDLADAVKDESLLADTLKEVSA